MWLTKFAALAALLIAMFPCACGCEEREILPHIVDQVFWAETIGLVSFGISWLTASHWVPGINAQRRPLFA